MDLIIIPILAILAVGIGFGLGILINNKKLAKTFDIAQKDSEQILSEANRERDRIIREAHIESKQENKERKRQIEQEYKKRKNEIAKLESKLNNREGSLEKKLSILDAKENELEKSIATLETEERKYRQLHQEYESLLEKNIKTLEEAANMSQEEAKRELTKSLEVEAKKQAREKILQIEEEAKAEAERKALATISLAVQRISSDFVNNSTITVVALPTDEMKGRIIGREGRNIRAIEQTTGVDLIIDDTPEAVILSCFNPLRREIAKISLERLIADGRIHPARIEETVKKVAKEFDQINLENGEQAAFDTGITDLHPEILRALGKLKYRTTGQQTVLKHSVEVAHICGIMAGEIGMETKKAKRAGLLHDIGKAVDQESEGHHAVVGMELAKKHGEAREIYESIRDHHHEDLTQAPALTVILHAANQLSSNRPGARKEVLETYVKRLKDLEEFVNKFDAVSESFVVQAGREIRAMVEPSHASDSDVTELSNEIAYKLRKEMTFPGQVKVTVLRESKVIEYAR